MANAADGATRLVDRARLFIAGLAIALASGCATNGTDPRDPVEGFNRAMYGFNDGFDQVIAKPVATGYRAVLPGVVRTGVRNFFSNLDDLFIGVNNLLQGKPVEAVGDIARLAVNSTIGILGLIDVASQMGLEKHNEDFGQTFGRWGVGDGPYFVWPLFGSSTLRDTVGGLLDFRLDPVRNTHPVDVRNVLYFTRAVSRRADLLDASVLLEEAALDKYVFVRDAYLQRRRSLIYDGNPPREERSSRDNGEPKTESAPAEGGGQVDDAKLPRAAGVDDLLAPGDTTAVLTLATGSGADDAESQP